MFILQVLGINSEYHLLYSAVIAGGVSLFLPYGKKKAFYIAFGGRRCAFLSVFCVRAFFHNAVLYRIPDHTDSVVFTALYVLVF